MPHISQTTLRTNLAHYLDKAATSRAPIVITRSTGKGVVVLLSEAEFAGWQETVHLLSSPANAARLLASIAEAQAGHTEAHALISADDPPA
jgi:antitoxin YefM